MTAHFQSYGLQKAVEEAVENVEAEAVPVGSAEGRIAKVKMVDVQLICGGSVLSITLHHLH